MKWKKMKGQGGFTLIELITVIIILGILAAVIAPRYFDMANNAEQAALDGALSEGVARFNMAYAQFVINEGTGPTDLSATGLGQADYLGADVTSIDVGDFTLKYVLAGTTVTLTATNAGGETKDTTFEWPE